MHLYANEIYAHDEYHAMILVSFGPEQNLKDPSGFSWKKRFWYQMILSTRDWEHFLEILASTHGPGLCGPRPLWSWWSWTIRTLWSWTIHNLKEFLSHICSRTIFEMHTHCSSSMFAIFTAPGALACLLYAPGAVCFSSMVLEHIYPRIFFKIVNGQGP